jgi:hypothetical protein
MGRIVIISVIIMLFAEFTHAQKVYDLQTDNITRDLFTIKQWKMVIKDGKEALKKDIDFYYLQLRMGISYFQLKNYMMAAKHLQKAYTFDQTDSVMLEYLYFSYIYLNRHAEAYQLASRHKDYLTTGVIQSLSKSSLRDAFLVAGYVPTNHGENAKKVDVDDTLSYFGDIITIGTTYLVSAGFTTHLSNSISYTQDYTYLNIDRTQTLFNNDTVFQIRNYPIQQNQIYFSPLILYKGFQIKPVFHLLLLNYDELVPTGFPDANLLPFYIERKITKNDYVARLDISKYLYYCNVGLFGSYAYMNLAKQYAAGLNLGIYPFGNLNLYSSTELCFQFQKKSPGPVLREKIGYKILSKYWIEAGYTFGESYNLVQDGGSTVYNLPNVIRDKWEINFIDTYKKHIQLFINFTRTNRIDSYYTYSTVLDYTENKINYNSNSITGGLKWTF